MHSHAHDAAEHSPRLHIASPEKRCGKTTLLSVLWPLVPRPVGTESISTSALFRTIEIARPTLLIDEADSFLGENEGLRGILNAGHSRSGTVIRSVGDDFEPRQFSVWCPTIIAGIGRISATLEDRSITIQLRRRLPTETIERLRSTRREHLFVLGRKTARWVSDHLGLLAESDPELPDALGDREQDNWRPLIAIAEAVGAGYPSVARSAALALSRVDMEDEQSAGVMLLADVWSILQERQADRIRSADVVLALVAMEHRPWPEWRRGKPLNQSTVSRLLKPFGIETRKSRFGNETARAYEREAIAEACERYAPLAIAAEGSKTGFQSGTVEQTSRNSDLREIGRGTPIATVPSRESAKSLNGFDCSSVPLQGPETEWQVDI
jgi:putative DNA primase/helicase